MSRSRIQQSLEKMGFFYVKNHYEAFIDYGIDLLNKMGSPDGFLKDSSCLRVDTPTLSDSATVMVIDIGGTHTKAGLAAHLNSTKKDWDVLFDDDNHLFDIPGEGLPIERFTKALAQRLTKVFKEREIDPTKIDGVGIIWSNALVVQHLPENGFPRGTTALVTGYNHGNAYRKGEFFTKELYDGFDIGQAFLNAMKEAHLTPKVFIIGNDTVFTLKACPKADAGMVASTGANATDIGDDGIIYNTEMGAICSISKELLSEGDHVLCDWDQTKSSIKLEDLISGKWLPRIFEGHVVALAKAGIESLADAAKYFSNDAINKLRGRDLEKLLKKEEVPEIFDVPACRGCLDELREIADLLIRRAGRLAAGMAYFSLYRQSKRKDSLVLSLDSSQARHLPGYLEALKEQLEELLGTEKKVSIQLQYPSGSIAVPMKGLAETLFGELARLQ